MQEKHKHPEQEPLLGRDHTAPDPELVKTATKFVQEIIEKAKAEAALKIKQDKAVSQYKIFFTPKISLVCPKNLDQQTLNSKFFSGTTKPRGKG